MATPMNSTQFRGVVEPIMNEVFDGKYDLRADEWKEFVTEIRGTPRSSHREDVLYGFGAAPELPEGSAITYDSGGDLFTKEYVYKVYGLAFALTETLIEDGEHIRIGSLYAEHLAQSLMETKETLCANLLNRAFNSSYKGGDGKELCATDHPAAVGTYSNELSTAAALSQTSLENLLVQIRNATDDAGKRVRIMPKKLIVPSDLQFQAERLLKSALTVGSANNDINAVKSMGLLDEGAAVISRLSSSTAWFIKTDAPRGVQLAKRRGLKRGMEGDFETGSMRYKATERYDAGWTNPRGIYGTAGL